MSICMCCTAINIIRKYHCCTTADSDTNTEIESLFSDTAVIETDRLKEEHANLQPLEWLEGCFLSFQGFLIQYSMDHSA